MEFDLCTCITVRSGTVSAALAERAQHALVIIYACVPNRMFDLLCRKADRVFFVALLPVPRSREALFRICQQLTLEVT